ncbi:hypothetical protein RN001_003521 [Aquatica leii]|uniref:Uncharacterized protein n=1 Tax=Aquatica leii TaxID=1421715 RepID=A0AAN7ST16_9COLE|nr:hypothetical protein RN001_003521 [Aquatica leii]
MSLTRVEEQKWEEEDMKNAVIAVRTRAMGYLKAAKYYNTMSVQRSPRTRAIQMTHATNISQFQQNDTEIDEKTTNVTSLNTTNPNPNLSLSEQRPNKRAREDNDSNQANSMCLLHQEPQEIMRKGDRSRRQNQNDNIQRNRQQNKIQSQGPTNNNKKQLTTLTSVENNSSIRTSKISREEETEGENENNNINENVYVQLKNVQIETISDRKITDTHGQNLESCKIDRWNTNIQVKNVEDENNILDDISEYSTYYMAQIIWAFRDVDISQVCKEDELIMKFGLLLFEKYNRHQYEFIRQSMRQLGRLLLAIEEVKLLKLTLQETLLPKNFDTLVMAVKHLCFSQRTEIHQCSFIMDVIPFKIKHNNTVVWVKLEKENFSYDGLIKLAYEKFPYLSSNDGIELVDSDGVVIDRDFFQMFLELNRERFLIEIKSLQNFNIVDSDLDLTITDSNISCLREKNNSDDGQELFLKPSQKENCIVKKKQKYVTAQVLKQLLKDKNCQFIFEEYNENKILTNVSRKKLVRNVCDIMESKHRELTKDVICDYAESLVELFPTFKVKDAKYGYKMKNTFYYRRQLGVNISVLDEFPRYLDTPGLIDFEFSLLYPALDVNLETDILNLVDQILNIYKATSNKTSIDIVQPDQTSWDKTTRAMFALLHMLPPTARGRTKGVKDNLITARDKLIVFKKVNVPLEDIVSKKETKQPFLVAEGANIGAIHSYKSWNMIRV